MSTADQCCLSRTRLNTEIMYGVGQRSFCSKFFSVLFLTQLLTFLLGMRYQYYKLLLLDYLEVLGMKIPQWLDLETKAEIHVFQRCFFYWLWLLPRGHWDSKDYFSKPCQNQLGYRPETVTLKYKQQPKIVHWFRGWSQLVSVVEAVFQAWFWQEKQLKTFFK